jgi:hypothetical protein
MLGSYTALPELLDRVGVSVDDIVCWEDEVEIRSSDGTSAILGASPLHRPVRTALGPVACAARSRSRTGSVAQGMRCWMLRRCAR